MKKTIPQHHDEIENVPDIGDQDEKVVRFVLAQLIAVGLRILGADQGALLLVDQGGRAFKSLLTSDSKDIHLDPPAPPQSKSGLFHHSGSLHPILFPWLHLLQS